ncbi:MAG: ROK family protein [Sneathiella sp.]|nr:ROK family protein [Sneathiella sp.]
MRYGIDLGGTKTEIIALTPDGGTAFRQRNETPRGSYQHILQNICDLVALADQETGGASAIGVGIPGTISPKTGLVKNANSTELIGHPLDQDLASLLGRPVRVANDANCFALSEASDGAGAGYGTVFGIIVGTGVGGGLIINGQVLNGAHSIAGEWGHSPLPWPEDDERPGPVCYCGKNGCIETFLSGPGMSSRAAEATGISRSPAELLAATEAGDPDAKAYFQTFERRIAKSLATVINVIDPDIIVCGGGLSNLGRIYKKVPLLWQEYVFSDGITTPFVPARFGDSSGVRGAAWLWPEE